MMSRRQAFAALAAMLPAENVPATNDEKTDVEKLVKMWADALRHLRLASPPIGSVQAFAGDWPPRKANGAWTELEIGWLLCDGRKLDDVQTKLHEELEKLKEPIPEELEKLKEPIPEGGILAELREVLPRLESGEAAVSLPNYCGMFLRGVDCGTDGKTTGNDKDGIRAVGTTQNFTTSALTQKPLVAKSATTELKFSYLAHSYPQQKNTTADYVVKNENGEYRHSFQQHTHEIAGGDDETRPINIAVNYIIKFQ